MNNEKITFEEIINISKESPEKAVQFVRENSQKLIFDEFDGIERNRGKGWQVSETHYGTLDNGDDDPNYKIYSFFNYDHLTSFQVHVNDHGEQRIISASLGVGDVIFEITVPKENRSNCSCLSNLN